METPSLTEEDVRAEVACLERVDKSSGWLRLFDNTEVTIGRGVDVTYQLLSPKCPLMISRLHCTFKQTEDGQWTVTDNKSMNGVWVNQCRLVVERAHPLRPGDSVQLGVPVSGELPEFDYILVQRPLKDIQIYLLKPHRDWTKAAHLFKKAKRKMTEETEPSTSSKRIRSSAQACPPPNQEPRRDSRVEEAARNIDGLQRFNENIVMKEQVDNFEEKLQANTKELDVTKEEEKARAQREKVVTQVTEVLENELQCIICSELFIEAVVLNCAHGFCLHCIQMWRKKKEECPICRQAIKSQTRCLALDNCINSMVDNLSLEMKSRRQELVNERKGVVTPPADVFVIPDEDSSVSSQSVEEEEQEEPVLVISSPSSSLETEDSEEQ